MGPLAVMAMDLDAIDRLFQPLSQSFTNGAYTFLFDFHKSVLWNHRSKLTIKRAWRDGV
jgi:hypothetical protein